MTPSTIPLTFIIVTLNEEDNLPICLDTLANWTREIIVVDSGSTDSTRNIAESYGARVIVHPFETHASQWKWILDNVRISTDWFFGFDADQRITPELQQELIELFADDRAGLAEFNGFFARRRQVFRGKWIRHGGYYPKHQLLLCRASKTQVDDNDLVDHHLTVEGKVGKLRHDFIEANLKENNIAFWIDKHNGYAALQAAEEFRRKRKALGWAVKPSVFGTTDQRTVWLKAMWMRLPLYLRPFVYFAYRYWLRLGFLDGKQGLVFHFLQGFWYRMLVDINLDDLLQREKESSTP